MIELTKEEKHAAIARAAAALLTKLCAGRMFVNLGVGIPLLLVEYLDDPNIFIHTENGMIGVGPLAFGDDVHPDLVNAGRQPVKETLGCAYTDVVESFGMIRGGHIDVAVLGAFEVDADGNISNWIVPGGIQMGVGGAMDLVVGARTVIVTMTHTNNGRPKLVQACTLPVTGYHGVDYAVTEMGVFHFEPGCRPVLEGKNRGYTVEDVRALTDFAFDVSKKLEGFS